MGTSPWVVNGYSLAFGLCLLPAGYAPTGSARGCRSPPGWRCSRWARSRRAAAGTPEGLVLGRLVQGVGGALLARPR